MAKTKIMIILFVCCLLVGCGSNYYGFDFNTTSSSSCSVQCENLMVNYSCFEGTPSYQEQFYNGEKLSGKCSCFIRGCRN